ncbi:MAG TPA: pentapeptide repeat-containing protein, partial [Stellaceae bacterium]|nr:pentapeptide repeat-containing protein [Stellaceae bacterium]
MDGNPNLGLGELRQLTPQELRQILQLHELYLAREAAGRRAVLAYYDLSSADLSEHDLSGADLTGARLHRAILKNTVLRQAKMSTADLRAANLNGADLSGADLRSSCLRGAQLNNAKLPEANMSKVAPVRLDQIEAGRAADDTPRTDLSSIEAHDCDFSGANLNGAAFIRADLTDAILSNTDLCGA